MNNLIHFDAPATWDSETEDLFREFLQMRKAKRKPLVTPRGLRGRIKELEALSGANLDLKKKILIQTLEREWLDFYALKDDKQDKWTKML